MDNGQAEQIPGNHPQFVDQIGWSLRYVKELIDENSDVDGHQHEIDERKASGRIVVFEGNHQIL